MEYDVVSSAGDSSLTVRLDEGEEIVASLGAIAAKSDSVSVKTGTGQSGGITGALKSATLTDDNPLQNIVRADSAGRVELCSQVPSAIEALELDSETVLIQTASYLGGSPELDMDIEAASKRSFLSSDGLFLTEISGTGVVFLAAFGGLRKISLDAGESYGVEAGHVVMFEESLEYSMDSMGDVKTSVLGGQGRIAEFEGPGEIWMQTSSHESLLDWIESETGGEGGLSSLTGN